MIFNVCEQRLHNFPLTYFHIYGINSIYMEKNTIRKILYNSPYWEVFRYIMGHPEMTIRGAQLVKALPHLSKSAIYNAIQQLEKIDALMREDNGGGYVLKRNNMWVQLLMIADRTVILQPLINAISDSAFRIVFFGSQANGDYTSDSDFDLFVVSDQEEIVRRKISKSELKEKIQLILKTPEEWLDMHKTDPELYESIQKGIVLWERK